MTSTRKMRSCELQRYRGFRSIATMAVLTRRGSDQSRSVSSVSAISLSMVPGMPPPIVGKPFSDSSKCAPVNEPSPPITDESVDAPLVSSILAAAAACWLLVKSLAAVGLEDRAAALDDIGDGGTE